MHDRRGGPELPLQSIEGNGLVSKIPKYLGVRRGTGPRATWAGAAAWYACHDPAFSCLSCCLSPSLGLNHIREAQWWNNVQDPHQTTLRVFEVKLSARDCMIIFMTSQAIRNWRVMPGDAEDPMGPRLVCA